MTLTDLDKVNWERLAALFEPATKIPEWIRTLVSGDHAAADEAFELLANNILHQGTVAEVTVIAISFLIDALSYPTVHPEADIVRLLVELVEIWLWEKGQRSGSLFGPDVPRIIDDLDELQAKLRQRIFEAVRLGIPTYLNLLRDRRSEVRRQALHLLSMQLEDAEQIAPRLLDFARTREDKDDKAAAIWHASNLFIGARSATDEWPKYIETFQQMAKELIAQNLSFFLTFASAVGLARIEGAEAPKEVDHELIYAIKHGSLSLQTPWTGDIVSDAIDAIFKLGPIRAESILIAAVCKAPTPDDTQQLADALLTLTIESESHYERHLLSVEYRTGADGQRERYYSRPHSTLPIGSLTAGQKQAVRAIVRCDHFWELRSNLFSVYGLPNTREQLQHML